MQGSFLNLIDNVLHNFDAAEFFQIVDTGFYSMFKRLCVFAVQNAVKMHVFKYIASDVIDRDRFFNDLVDCIKNIHFVLKIGFGQPLF